MGPEVVYEGDRRGDQSEYIRGGAPGPTEKSYRSFPHLAGEGLVVVGELCE